MGLEVKGTSCHNVEALGVEEAFDGMYSLSGSSHLLSGRVLQVIYHRKASKLMSLGLTFTPLFTGLTPCDTLKTCLLLLFQPLGSINLKTYSDNTSTTTGVLDHPSMLSLMPALFYKTLVYLLRREQQKNRWGM
jgi:hypothetical protein